MNDILKEITVGELLAIDDTGETSFEIAQHSYGGTVISIVRNGLAVMLMQRNGEAVAGEPLTKEGALEMMRKSIMKAARIDERGGVIGEGKNTVADENTESDGASDDTQDAEPLLGAGDD